VRHRQEADRTESSVEEATPQEAFALGRAYEREQAGARVSREAFLQSWAKTLRRLRL